MVIVESYCEGVLISREVQADLRSFYIFDAPEKCEWDPKQVFEWLGILF